MVFLPCRWEILHLSMHTWQRAPVLSNMHSSAMLSFWAQQSGAKNLALDFSADQQQGEMLRPPRRTQHDSAQALSRTS